MYDENYQSLSNSIRKIMNKTYEDIRDLAEAETVAGDVAGKAPPLKFTKKKKDEDSVEEAID